MSPSCVMPRMWPSSCAMMNAEDSPSSLMSEQLLAGSHTPATGA